MRNAFGCSRQAFFENEEVQAITRIILGSDYKKGFSVEDCKVEKVIFMADGDVDGSHISALLLRMFVMYFPQMIEAGMVYKAIAPLYSIKTGTTYDVDPRTGKKKKRDQRTYFTEQIDIVKYNQKEFLKLYNVENMDGRAMTKFFIKNVDYVYYMDNLANTYSVNPYLLELVLYHYISNNNKIIFKKLQKEVKSAYRFMDVDSVNDIIVVKGTIEKSNVIVLNDKFFNDCKIILDNIRLNEELYYKVNGKICSIYTIMSMYKSISPANVQRYKGLGEMPPGELSESTLYPGSDRTLVRYTMEDAKDTIETIREYESDMKKILGLVGTVTREDLLD